MLRNRTLAALLTAEVVSSTGSVLTFVALPWFVLETGSPARMSVVLAAEALPMALFGIPSGSVVARLGARTSMLISDAVRAPLVALVPILHWTGHLEFWMLLAIVFAIGVFTTPYIASQRTILPELFGDDETLVTKASGLFGAANQLPILIGPAIGGVLISLVGTAPLIMIDAATFLFAFFAILLFVRGGRRAPADESSKGVFAGVRFLARDSFLGPVALTVIVLDGAANAIAVGVPLLAFTRYDQNPHVFGFMFAAFGIGAVASSILVVKLLDHVKPLRLACIGILGAALPIWLIAVPIPWPVAALVFFVCGVFVPLVNAPTMGIITTRPPEALRAKVLTSVMTASALGVPLGRVLVGPVYNSWGNSGVWIAIAGGMTAGAVLFVTTVILRSPGDATDVGAVADIAHEEANLLAEGAGVQLGAQDA
jgi:predicted MFS family arabinose efflux permease